MTHPQSGLFHCSINDDLDLSHSNGFFWILFINSWNSNEKKKKTEILQEELKQIMHSTLDMNLRSVWERVPLQTCGEAIQPSCTVSLHCQTTRPAFLVANHFKELDLPHFQLSFLLDMVSFQSAPRSGGPLLFDPTWNPPRPSKIESSGFQESTSPSKSFTSPLCLCSITGMKNYLVV